MICDLNNTNWENIENGVQKYLLVMQLVKTSNVQTNKEFQKIFNGFYKIRRSIEFREALYDYLEHNKNKEISFEQTLDFFRQKFQRFEPSFSSKIVATIDSNLPIWDSKVIINLKLKKPNNSWDLVSLKNLNLKNPDKLDGEIRLEEMVKIYAYIVEWYSEFLKTEQAKNMIKTFDGKIGILNITDIRKIDLILWQTRS